MRKPLIVGVVVVLAAVAVLLVRRPATDGSPAAASSESGTVRTTNGSLSPTLVQAGEVLVSIDPVRIDRTGAVFRIGFETHTVDLSLDVASSASFEVDGTPWANPTWKGSPPGGHHRDGELRFEPAGKPLGEAVLTIEGLAEPVVASWSVG